MKIFISTHRGANLRLSHNMKGYNRYSSDLGIIARVVGFDAHIIDFQLRHNSGGNVDASFDAGPGSAEMFWLSRNWRASVIALPYL